MSKAALNAGFTAMAQDLGDKGISTFLIHPVVVSTKINHFRKDSISTEESAKLIIDIIKNKSIKNKYAPIFFNEKGDELAF